MRIIYYLIAKDLIPDFLITAAIRFLLFKRLKREKLGGAVAQNERKENLIQILKSAVIAVKTEKANSQHYEIPPDFYRLVLGDHLKYSACLWEEGQSTGSLTGLSKAEFNMLELYCERAGLSDGIQILELGCGWGSLSLYMAKKYPNSKITALSNSNSQREFILRLAKERGLENLNVITDDVNRFDTKERFDRVVSVEMFEHMRNYSMLLKKVSSWLKDGGQLFVHIFCHRELAYLFEEAGLANWMGRYFFSGGIMPSDDLLLYFQEDLQIEKHWRVNGLHYGKTADAWHINLINKKDKALPVLASIYSDKEKYLWLARWKLFFLACRELFSYKNGEEWMVSHYLFRKR